MNVQASEGRGRFVPTNPCLGGILKLFSDKRTADVVFEVNGEEKFYAHRLILQACAPDFAEYCGDDDESDVTSVPIAGVKTEVFRHLLRYVYGGKVPDKIFSEHSKEIIEAADRFGVGNLKVEAEGWYVASTPITLDNFAEALCFSDTKKCALLKEKLMDFLLQNETEALAKLSKANVPQSESMLTDFLTASARKKRRLNQTCHDFKTTSIDALRRALDRRGLNTDGTREMLVSSLEEECPDGATVEGATVEGAGATQINGFYVRKGSHDEVPKYVKGGRHNNEDVEFTLFRCRLTDNTRRWYISIVPPTVSPGTSRDIDFYAATPIRNEKAPPGNSWLCVRYSGGRGIAPPPKVNINFISNSEDDSTFSRHADAISEL